MLTQVSSWESEVVDLEKEMANVESQLREEF
jgi:hypothetical protein